jgi:hypothetical protein
VRKLTPCEVRRVTEAVKAGFTVGEITRGTATQKMIVNFAKLRRHRVEHPEFDRFVIENARGAGSRVGLLKCRIVPANAHFDFKIPTIIKPARKEIPPFLYQDGDLDWIGSLIPRGFPQRDDVIHNIFMDLCARAISRDEVPGRIKALKTDQERLFPMKYRKFGDSALVSLDEVLFEDGSTTRGDTVSRGLWD